MVLPKSTADASHVWPDHVSKANGIALLRRMLLVPSKRLRGFSLSPRVIRIFNILVKLMTIRFANHEIAQCVIVYAHRTSPSPPQYRPRDLPPRPVHISFITTVAARYTYYIVIHV